MAKLVFVLYKHLGQFLSTENATLRGLGDLNKHNLSLTVNSHILSASITKESSRVFVADPVIFTLEHLDVSPLLRFTHTAVRSYFAGGKKTKKKILKATLAFYSDGHVQHFVCINAEKTSNLCQRVMGGELLLFVF